MLRDLGIVIVAFAVGTLLAEAFGAVNLGTAFAFGQIAFVATVTGLLAVRR